MRVRIIFLGVILLIAIRGISAYLALTPQGRSGPQSSGLAASIVGCTNSVGELRKAMVEVRNRGQQSIWLNDFVTIQYFDTARSSDSLRLTNAVELKSGATQLFCISAPT